MGMSVPKVAAELGCGIDQVRNLIAAGELPAGSANSEHDGASVEKTWTHSRQDVPATRRESSIVAPMFRRQLGNGFEPMRNGPSRSSSRF